MLGNVAYCTSYIYILCYIIEPAPPHPKGAAVWSAGGCSLLSLPPVSDLDLCMCVTKFTNP